MCGRGNNYLGASTCAINFTASHPILSAIKSMFISSLVRPLFSPYYYINRQPSAARLNFLLPSIEIVLKFFNYLRPSCCGSRRVIFMAACTRVLAACDECRTVFCMPMGCCVDLSLATLPISLHRLWITAERCVERPLHV